MTEQAEYTYDVFISYSHTDSEWVRDKLLPRLEEAELKVVIDCRDFEPGVPSLLNMENAINLSRKALIVLTPDWVESEWTTFESLLIQTDDPVGRQARIIPLRLKSCEPPKRIAILTYIDFTKPAEFESQLKRLVAAIGVGPEQETQLELWYQEGIQAFVNGQWATAIKYFEQVVAQDPLYKNAAELLEEAKAKRHQEKELDSWYQKGVEAMPNGQWVTAIKYFEQVVAQDPLYKNAAELLKEVKLQQETQERRLRVRVIRVLHHPTFLGIGVIVAVLALLWAIVTAIGVPMFPSAVSSVSFSGKVCQIKKDWDTNTIFLQETEFGTLGLPVGTKVTVTVLDTGKSAEDVTLSLDSRLEICSVRLAKPLREALGVDSDTTIASVSDRPDRSFDVTSTSPPTNEEGIAIRGKVCMIKADQDTKTMFLRRIEFDAFGIPAGTTVSVTALDTGETVEKITLSLDSGLTTCVVRLPMSYREALGVAGDTATDAPENRPDRQFLIRLLQP